MIFVVRGNWLLLYSRNCSRLRRKDEGIAIGFVCLYVCMTVCMYVCPFTTQKLLIRFNWICFIQDGSVLFENYLPCQQRWSRNLSGVRIQIKIKNRRFLIFIFVAYLVAPFLSTSNMIWVEIRMEISGFRIYYCSEKTIGRRQFWFVSSYSLAPGRQLEIFSDGPPCPHCYKGTLSFVILLQQWLNDASTIDPKVRKRVHISHECHHAQSTHHPIYTNQWRECTHDQCVGLNSYGDTSLLCFFSKWYARRRKWDKIIN